MDILLPVKLVIDMNWSKIQYTELATEAYILMNENEIKGCRYHNNSHIDAMYEYLEDTDEPYDEALDWAIMFHDVVYDAEPEKELRSAMMFLDMVDKYRGCRLSPSEKGRAYSLIMQTVDHEVFPNVKGSSAIIRADLHALTVKEWAINNFSKIMNESMALYDCEIEEFAHNNIKFMSGLHARMAINILKVEENEKLFFHRVQSGIDLTIRLAQAIKDVEIP